MPRREAVVEELRHFEQITNVGEDALRPEDKARLLAAIRAQSPESAARLDSIVVGEIDRSRRCLVEAQAHHQKLRDLLDQATAPPWHPAVYVRPVEMAEGLRAMVWFGGRIRIVNYVDGLDSTSLATGDEVFLNNDLNLIMGRSPLGMPQVGETAAFERYVDDGRMVLRHRDDEVVCDVADELRGAILEQGDQVRWDKSTWMAYEKIDRPQDERHVVKEMPEARPEQVGGQRDNLREMLRVLTAALVSPDMASRYGLPSKRSVLLVGPPGCGKTLMARVSASEIGRISGKKCRFYVVKPAEWESMWVGETQANIRRTFESMRTTGTDGYSFLFLDEVESVGRTRGNAIGGAHGDKFLAALLAEIDGFRANANVVLVAATNRKDLIDQALLERLSDVELVVRRPDMQAAREIFGVHLPGDLPFSPNGDQADDTRRQLIDVAVSRLYSPNADNQVATIKFRDSTVRTVTARELISGRVMEQVCTAAKQSAFYREIDGGSPGLQVRDMEESVDSVIHKLSSTLTRINVRSYLDDLPQDMEVISVTPVVRKVKRTHRFLNVPVTSN